MNAYDFDKTVYDGDSTADFYFYSMRRHPSVLLLLPSLISAALLWAFGKYTKTQFKERFYRFLTKIGDTDLEVIEFWERHEKKIRPEFREKLQSEDFIISASPEFLLKPICERLCVNNLIASKVDKHSGRYAGENCWGEEKVSRLYKEFGSDILFEEFYSDSLSDTPLARLAKKSFIVTKKTLIPWEEYREKNTNGVKLFSLEFLKFVAIGCLNTINGTIFSWLYSLKVNANAAFVLGYVTSLFVAYILNSRLIFRQKLEFTKFVKFGISYIPNFLIQNVAVIVFFNLLQLPKLFAYACAAVIGVPITFVCVKLFVFGRKKYPSV